MATITMFSRTTLRTAALAALIALGVTAPRSAAAQSSSAPARPAAAATRTAMTGKTTVQAPDSLAKRPAEPVAFTQLTSAMSSLAERSNRFVRLPLLRAEQIALVDVRNVFRYSAEQQELENALARHERDITAMRNTLQASMLLRDMLYARQLQMSQVIAVDVAPDGRTATVFYRAE